MATAETLIIAGGGSGGVPNPGVGNSGGGGAGGYQYNASVSITPQDYTIIVGIGGSVTGGAGSSTNGGNSSFAGITAIGGGHGGDSSNNGANGGCGGGAGATFGSTLGGTGSQGRDGAGVDAGSSRSGGGGGALITTITINDPNGGDGIANSISGSSIYYAGGGAGGNPSGVGTGGLGGGANFQGGGGLSGTNGLGGGGGGTNGSTPINNVAGPGGSGVVIISYVTADFMAAPLIATGGTITTNGTKTVHTFTSNGIFRVEVPLIVNVSDSINITENIIPFIPLYFIDTSSQISIIDSFSNLVPVSFINDLENITIGEQIDTKMMYDLSIDIFDLLTIKERPSTLLIGNFVDFIEISDIPIMQMLDNNIDIIDSITISENENILTLFNVYGIDQIDISANFSDTPSIMEISIYEIVNISEPVSFENFRFTPDIPGKIVGTLLLSV